MKRGMKPVGKQLGILIRQPDLLEEWLLLTERVALMPMI